MTQWRVLSGVLYLTMEPLIIIGAVYFVLTFTLSKGVAVIERRMAQSD
jgi:ABC-type amino acid transport system permease subunit